VPAPTRVVRLHVDAALVERRLSSDPSRRTQAARPARGPGVTRGWARRRPGGSAPARRPAGPRDQRSDLLVAGLDLTDPATQAPVVERPLTPERGSGEHAAGQAAEADRDQQEASPFCHGSCGRGDAGAARQSGIHGKGVTRKPRAGVSPVQTGWDHVPDTRSCRRQHLHPKTGVGRGPRCQVVVAEV
jgi:hypothetical protein